MANKYFEIMITYIEKSENSEVKLNHSVEWRATFLFFSQVLCQNSIFK